MRRPSPRLRLLSAAASLVALVALASPVAAPASAAPRDTSPRAATVPGAATPCLGTTPPSVWTHVIWIIMENHAASQILGSTQAPYLNHLVAACGRAATYYAVSHPSLPNYLVLTSGSTHGVTDDANPSAHPLGGPSIFTEVAATHRGWTTYAESMPRSCYHLNSGEYVVRHNPATYYIELRSTCVWHDAALGTPTAGPFVTRLREDRLSPFTMVVPNVCHDMHDCSVATGDAWVRAMMSSILSSRTYAAGGTAVFITWDEDNGAHGNQVALIAVAPSIRPGTVAGGTFTHRSLLRTTEQLIGLPRTLVPTSPSMRAAFHI